MKQTYKRNGSWCLFGSYLLFMLLFTNCYTTRVIHQETPAEINHIGLTLPGFDFYDYNSYLNPELSSEKADILHAKTLQFINKKIKVETCNLKETDKNLIASELTKAQADIYIKKINPTNFNFSTQAIDIFKKCNIEFLIFEIGRFGFPKIYTEEQSAAFRISIMKFFWMMVVPFLFLPEEKGAAFTQIELFLIDVKKASIVTNIAYSNTRVNNVTNTTLENGVKRLLKKARLN